MPFISTTNRGYDVNATQRRGAKPPHNGWISIAPSCRAVRPESELTTPPTGSNHAMLYVHEVQVGFALAGNVAQSAHTRSFFTHNFVQPTFSVLCQAPDQEEYGRVIEFIRESQVRGIQNDVAVLHIMGGGAKIIQQGSHTQLSTQTKGYHQPIVACGYVATVQRLHQKGIYAPDYNFEFVVSRILLPKNWADRPVTIRRLKTWHQIVSGILARDKNAGFITNPDDSEGNQPQVGPQQQRPDF